MYYSPHRKWADLFLVCCKLCSAWNLQTLCFDYELFLDIYIRCYHLIQFSAFNIIKFNVHKITLKWKLSILP